MPRKLVNCYTLLLERERNGATQHSFVLVGPGEMVLAQGGVFETKEECREAARAYAESLRRGLPHLDRRVRAG